MFWQKNLYKAALRSIFDWASGVVNESDAIFVDLADRRGYFYFEFPLRYGDRPRSANKPPEGRKITFIIRRPTGQAPDDQWIKIFSSPDIEILENKNRANYLSPLRWGLNDDEKKISLKIARDALEKFLVNSVRLDRGYFNTLSPRFFFKTDLDVTLWVRGYLRGSAVVENQHLGEGLVEAVILASCDRRFKPLAYEELAYTRIEITLIPDLRIPLSKDGRRKNIIYPEKGYLLEKDGQKGWFLPEVFNVLRFSNLEEFLETLAQEKARLSRSDAALSGVYIFEVNDFIESSDRSSVVDLWGPTVRHQLPIPNPQFIIRLRKATDWLLRVQEQDGNIPAIIDPLTGRIVKQIDWPRLAFTARALAEFGKAVQEKKYTQAAEKSFEFLKQHLTLDSRPQIPGYELTLACFGQLALALGKMRDAEGTASKALGRAPKLLFEPITFGQTANFLKTLSKSNKQFSAAFESLTKALKENFESKQKSMEPMDLAAWAELVNTFRGIDNEFSQKVADWLKGQQMPNGAFPESTMSNFTYTRGTGKIFEVLALDPKKNRDALSRALTWLLSMQYDEENTFFVLEEVRPKILGSFRHDYFNQEAWIDAAGHVILGAARLLTL